jgi:transcriptional regulator with XRE-family HTH domain
MRTKGSDERAHAVLLGTALKAVRKDRRLRTSEVARAMGMPLRSYEHFEAGRARITFDRLAKFAEVTNSDPLALLAAIPLQSPEFALRCADNKLMTVMMIALSELNEELGEDIEYLETGTLIGAFTRIRRELVEHVRKRDTFAETWLQEKTCKVKGASPVTHLDWRRRAMRSQP